MMIQGVLAMITKGPRASSILLAVMAGLALGAAAPAWAQQFTEAEIFVEINDTDGDLGLHASIDGGPYTKLTVEDPKGLTILTVAAQGRLAKQGSPSSSWRVPSRRRRKADAATAEEAPGVGHHQHQENGQGGDEETCEQVAHL